MNPMGGQSYNPNTKDHKVLLKDVAHTEEEAVQENLKEIRRQRPLLFARTEKEEKEGAEDDSEESGSEEQEKVESSEEEDSEDVDMDKPLGINAQIDRKNSKTQAQRNKAQIQKIKEQK